MTNPHRCVIDKKGFYVTFVIVDTVKNDNGELLEVPRHYALGKMEELIKAVPPSNMSRPQWTGKEWKELATPDEIEAAEKANYEAMGLLWPPEPPAPSENEYLLESVLDLDFRTTMLELGL